jgi:serine/threonine protein kinase
MAPELINFGKYNSKVDIWSIGVISYEMANGDVFVRQRRSAYGVDTM